MLRFFISFFSFFEISGLEVQLLPQKGTLSIRGLDAPVISPGNVSGKVNRHTPHDIFSLLSSHEIIIPQYGVKFRSRTILS